MEENTRNIRLSPLEQLGAAVAQYRVLVEGLSQKDFAAKLDISKPTLISIEKGDPGVSIGTMFKIFRLMNIDFSLSALAHEAGLQSGVTQEHSDTFLKELFNEPK